jgi:glyoxylase-like metal-dependent hydrolase (beta-lactamase superfamily II)
MRVHHLNCGSLCPRGGALVGGAGWLGAGQLVCHCLLVETNEGLVLVDAGLGLHDVRAARERLGRGFLALTRPRLDPAETALRQVERLGFAPDDVRHIVLTHLDPDHAGGIADFPAAEVHVLDAELSALRRPVLAVERTRYRPIQLRHEPRLRTHQADRGERWFGFERVRPIATLGDDLLVIPLHGHSRGHAGVAVRATRGDGATGGDGGGAGWLLHCGDAYFFHEELELRPRCPPGLALMQQLDQVDASARRHNQARLRTLRHQHAGEVTLFCAHDAVELARMQRAAASVLGTG